ncbi:hypothetical protein ABE132_17195 [Peribacillus simplex]|uniref:hypothetical protein n=1 Tax=Peribacillus simplex TaxID=1478 RepID=UPI003D2E6B2F
MAEEKNREVSAQQVELPGCTPTVSAQVCVEADITVTPTVVAGTPVVNCVGNPTPVSCQEMGFTPSATGSCVFTVSQVLCINIPITFDAEANTVTGTVACGELFNGPNCEDIPPPGVGCVHTRGFFGSSPQGQALTAQLITDFGPIVLGNDNSGLSLTIDTAAEAQAVFDNNPPAPAPTNPPCANNLVAQYHQLYAQLLTANLNVLNLEQQGFAVCQEALDVIAAANAFIAASTTPCGVTGAPAFSALLTDFNEGTLSPNCPPHCDDEI